jgi:hypothetical protein
MKLSEAQAIIDAKETYIVSFEMREGAMLRSDFFPDVRAGEKGFGDTQTAWEWAMRFAKACPNAVNVHICRASNFTPVGPKRLSAMDDAPRIRE